MAASRVAVVGGGPGGLATALALLRRGVSVTVFERASSLAPGSGGGFGLGLNGMRALTAISPRVASEVMAASQPVADWTIASEGRPLRTLWDAPLLRLDDGTPILRGCLRAELMHALRSALPADALLLGTQVQGVQAGGDGRGAVLSVSRGAEAWEQEFDAVIGADGLRSRIRGLLFPLVEAPAWSGYEVFYGVSDPSSPAFPHSGAAQGQAAAGPQDSRAFNPRGLWQAFGKGRYFINAPARVRHTGAAFPSVAAAAPEVGSPTGTPTAYFGFVRKVAAPAGSAASLAEGQWESAGADGAAQPAGGRWRGAASGAETKEALWAEVSAGQWGEACKGLVASTPAERILRFPMFYRPPIPSWHAGRVALLGDAAHAPLPSAGQGVNMALEDAFLVGNLLADALQGRLEAAGGKGLGAEHALWRADWEERDPALAAAARSQAPATPGGARSSGVALDAAVASAFAAYQARRHAKTAAVGAMARDVLRWEAGVTSPLGAAVRDRGMALALPLIFKKLKADVLSDPLAP